MHKQIRVARDVERGEAVMSSDVLLGQVVQDVDHADIVVITHGRCIDGTSAAAIIYGWWKQKVAPNGMHIYFHSGVYGKDPPAVNKRQRVIIADFCYSLEHMQQLVANSSSVLLLDHHATARDNCKELLDSEQIEGWFDMKRSGAALAYDWFFGSFDPTDPSNLTDEELRKLEKVRPLLVNYVSDRDLWLLDKRELCKAVSRWLGALPYDLTERNLARWWELLTTFELDQSMRAQMSGVERIVEGTARAFAETQWPMTIRLDVEGEIQEWVVPAVNAPNFWTSETLDYILQTQKDAPFAVGVFVTGIAPAEGQLATITYSLRSRSDFDVSAIAKVIGGGGHLQAAGAEVRNPEIVAQVLANLTLGASVTGE